MDLRAAPENPPHLTATHLSYLGTRLAHPYQQRVPLPLFPESKPTCKGSIVATVEMVLWAEITPSNSGVCVSQEHYIEKNCHNGLS